MENLIFCAVLNGQQTDKLRENIIQIFKNLDFKIEIEANLIEVDFVDVIW